MPLVRWTTTQGSRQDEKGGRWSWTFKLAQKRSWAGRWSWTLGPEEIMNREVELGCESWTSFAPGCFSTAVQQTLSLWLCPARQLKQQLRSALVAEQWRGDTALTLPLFLRRSRVSPVFWGQYPRSSLHSFILSPPTVPVPNKQPRLCGCKATWSRSRWTKCYCTEWKWIYSALE